MRAACHTMDSVTLKGRDWAKTSRQLEEKLAEVHTLDCLHIGLSYDRSGSGRGL